MDVTPIIVFNNKDNKLFGKSLSEYSISNVITCNSYNFGSDIFFSSTDFIGIKDVMNSLANNKPKNLFEFYKEFSNRYSTFVYNDNKRLVTIVAVGSVAIGGGSGLIIYYNQND